MNYRIHPSAPLLLQRRNGVTLLEVLVAIGVMGVLASVIVPSVQSARATSRRIQCAANMKQIVTAAIAYQGVQGHFPTGDWRDQLPVHLSYSIDTQKLAVIACPADEEATGEWHHQRYSYRINNGLSDWGDGLVPHGGKVGIKSSDVRDGLSHTAAFGERLAWPAIAGMVVYWDEYPQCWNRRLRDTPTKQDTLEGFAEECEYRALKPLTVWHNGVSYNYILPPNRPSCVNSTLTESAKAWTASSQHTFGVNLTFADGSLRYFSDDVDRGVWQALATRAGHELFNDF